MKELIPISRTALSGSEVQTCDARALHAFLEVGRDFSNWIKDRIGKYGFVEGVDFITLARIGERDCHGGQNRIDYILTLDMAKQLAMVENNEKGIQVRRYFIECERIAKESQRPKRPRPQSRLDRRFTAGLYKDMAKLKAVPDEMKTVFMAKAIEIMTDEPVNALLPRITDGRETWLSPTDIGKRMGVNRNVVGRALTALGLHGDNDPGHEWSQPVWNKAQGHNKEVKSYLYDPAIIPQIEDYLTTPRPATAEPRPHFSVVG